MSTSDPEANYEKPGAVRMMRRLDHLADLFTAGPLRRSLRHLTGRRTWPSTPGAYSVGDPEAPVAVCTLTSNALNVPVAALPGVAIAGRLYTANLGIEKIVQNITENPSIRFLLVCGKESPLFHPGQSLRSLWKHGITPDRRIIAAQGHLPELSNLQTACIECFRKQVELVDCTGEVNVGTLAQKVRELAARNPGAFPDECEESEARARFGERGGEDGFVELRPGGRREPLAYDPQGFYIITIDRQVGEIVLRHYLPDNSPAHLMRGRNAEAILLGLLRENLISQLSHAGYLGAELAKAETALRLGLRYEQDQPLKAVHPKNEPRETQ